MTTNPNEEIDTTLETESLTDENVGDETVAAEPGDAMDPEPIDGRDSQPAVGSSDEPELLDSDDPLKDPQQVADESDSVLQETPLPENADETPLDR